ncbi:GldM family protein [Bacteroidota bacterium]
MSSLIPLSNIKINVDFSVIKNINEKSHNNNFVNTQNVLTVNEFQNYENLENLNQQQSYYQKINWIEIIKKIYFFISLILLTRFFVQIFIISIQYLKSERIKRDNFIFVYNDRFKNNFSFFKWIFICNNFESKEDTEEIIIHEKVHASQYHSIDLILIELLAAVMWFNPLVWMIRKEIQLVHEYLADEGALSTGIDRLKYQALLINKITEERLICLSSSFNHSLIKKRMIMMTNSKINQRTKLRILALVPLAIFLILGVACVNGLNSDKNDIVAAIAPTKMNVLYLGVDNPVITAVSGYKSSELDVLIKEDGTIKGSNGNYFVRPHKPGNLVIVVKHGDEIIQEAVFRVKRVPDPIPMIAGKTGGTIEKQVLMQQQELLAVMPEWFDFNMSFEVVEFLVSAKLKDGYVREYTSNSNKITNDQRKLFDSLDKEMKVYFEDIKCKGSDGTIRNVGTIAFKIN